MKQRPEGSTVEGRRHGHHSIDHRHEAEEQHNQQDTHVEVVGARGFKDPLVRHVAAHDCPALEVHGGHQTQDIYTHQPGCVKGTHPEARKAIGGCLLG